MSGLSNYDLITRIRNEPETFKLLFCFSDIFKWSYDVFMSIHKVNWSPDGSNRKAAELKTYRAFIEMMEFGYYDGNFLINSFF